MMLRIHAFQTICLPRPHGSGGTTFFVSSAAHASILVAVCTAIANSPYAMCAVVSPFFFSRFGVPCLSRHCEVQCGPLQMTHFRCAVLVAEGSSRATVVPDVVSLEHLSVFCLWWPRKPELQLLLPVPWPVRQGPPVCFLVLLHSPTRGRHTR